MNPTRSPRTSNDSGRDSPSQSRSSSPDYYLKTAKMSLNRTRTIHDQDNRIQIPHPKVDQLRSEAQHYTDSLIISNESTDVDLADPVALFSRFNDLSSQRNVTKNLSTIDIEIFLSQIIDNIAEEQKDKRRKCWKNPFLIEDLPAKDINCLSITSFSSLDFLDLATSIPTSNQVKESTLNLSVLDLECYEKFKVSARRLRRYSRTARHLHASNQQLLELTPNTRLLGSLHYNFMKKLFISYFWQHHCTVKTTVYSFEKLLLEIGFYSNLDWCIRIAIRFSRGHSIEMVGECLSKQFVKDRNDLNTVAVTEIRNTFRNRYQSLYNIVNVSIGKLCSCQPLGSQAYTIAVITRGYFDETSKIDTFFGMDVIFRDENEFSEEAVSLLRHERQDAVHIKINARTKSDLLKAHSNITIISASSVISRRFNKSCSTIQVKPCLVIYCRIKGFIPFGERSFPTTIEEYPVDVREGACSLAVDNENCLRIGDRIGPADRKAQFGTLGGFINIDPNDPTAKAFVTCAHVVCSNNILKRTNLGEYITNNCIAIVDKYIPDGQNTIGVVSRAVFQEKSEGQVSVDAALVKITTKAPEDGEFTHRINNEQLRSAGFSEYNKPSFFNGETTLISPTNFRKVLVKVGAASEMTLGHLLFKDTEAVILNNVDLHHSGDIFHIHGQMEVLPLVDTSRNNVASPASASFITHGDSGSFVFMIEQDCPPILKCVGMAIAVTSYGSCLMTPINQVLSNLGIPEECISKFASKNFATKQTKPLTEESLKSILQDFKMDIVTKIDSTTQRVAAVEDSLKNLEQKENPQSQMEGKQFKLCSIL